MTRVSNLAQFKRAISEKKRFEIIEHYVHPECIGQIRKPHKIQTNAFTSVIDGDPSHEVSKANGGEGYYLWYGKASQWDFDGEYITAHYRNGAPIMKIRFID